MNLQLIFCRLGSHDWMEGPLTFDQAEPYEVCSGCGKYNRWI